MMFKCFIDVLRFIIVLCVILVRIHGIMEILNYFHDFHGILAICEVISTEPTINLKITLFGLFMAEIEKL